MSLYKDLLAYLVFSYISRISIWRSTARSENRSSGVVDLEQVLIHFISENYGSASAFVIGRVQAMTRRRQMFGKASSSQTPGANIRLFGSSLSVDWQSVFHRRT